MGRRPILVASVLALLAVAIATILASRAERRSRQATSAEAVAGRPSPPGGAPLPVLWDAPAFSFHDQDGRPFGDRDLRGHVWIADFFFTSCTSICPAMTARMAELQRVVWNPSVHLVSFSVDPGHDTPPVLHEYARLWRADGSRWHFLSTDGKGLAETAAGMKTFVSPPGEDGPIQHSAIFALTDGEGRVRGVYDSTDPVALRRLATDALTLAGTPPAQPPAVDPAWAAPEPSRESGRPGQALYVTTGCLACHTQSRVAPPLAGRLGTSVHLADGSSATFDADYVRESILDPRAKVVAGYPASMPGYRGRLTATQVEQLVEYIAALEGDAAPGGAPPGSHTAASGALTDPVCGMAVEDTPGALRATHRGQTFLFCSPTCRERFLKRPEEFVHGGEGRPDAAPRPRRS